MENNFGGKMLPNKFYEGIRVYSLTEKSSKEGGGAGKIASLLPGLGLNIYHRLLLVLDLKITVILY